MSGTQALPLGATAPASRAQRLAWTIAAAPLLVALAALFVVFLTGFDGRSAMPPEVAGRFYGFFLDRYPLFAFALVYGLARILAAALAPGRSGVLRRIVGVPIGLALVLGSSLHPTFGGLVLRAGFATGSGAFLNGTPMIAAYAMGAGAAALVFGLALGLGRLVIGRGGEPKAGGLGRRAGRALLGWLAGFLALWFAAALIGLARDAGFGPWPRRPLDARDLLVATALLTAAALPHGLLVAKRLRSSTCGPPPGRSLEAASAASRREERRTERAFQDFGPENHRAK